MKDFHRAYKCSQVKVKYTIVKFKATTGSIRGRTWLTLSGLHLGLNCEPAFITFSESQDVFFYTLRTGLSLQSESQDFFYTLRTALSLQRITSSL